MLKNLIKYELKKGTLPYIVIMISLTLMFSLLCYQILTVSNNFDTYTEQGMALSILGLVLVSSIVLFLLSAGGILNFVQGIMYLSDEFFREKGYLTFSTPNSSYKIIFSKLLTYSIRIISYCLVVFFFALIILKILSTQSTEFYDILYFLENNPIVIILFCFWYFLGLMNGMLIVYLIMTVNVTIFDFKHKILASFIMYLILTTFMQIFNFSIQLFLNLINNEELMAFYELVSTEIPMKFSSYGHQYSNMIPFPLVPAFTMMIGMALLLYFIICKLINRGINI